MIRAALLLGVPLLGLTSCLVPSFDVDNEGTTAPHDERDVLCRTLPISAKSHWVASASTSITGNGAGDPRYSPPAYVADGTLDRRWASGTPQTNGQWLQIDFGKTIAVSRVILEQGNNVEDYPRSYRLSLSDETEDFGALMLAAGEGVSSTQIVIPLAHVSRGRYLLIRQTGDADSWWSVAELLVACE